MYPKVAISSGGNIHVHKSFAVAAFIVHVLRNVVGTTVLWVGTIPNRFRLVGVCIWEISNDQEEYFIFQC